MEPVKVANLLKVAIFSETCEPSESGSCNNNDSNPFVSTGNERWPQGLPITTSRTSRHCNVFHCRQCMQIKLDLKHCCSWSTPVAMAVALRCTLEDAKSGWRSKSSMQSHFCPSPIIARVIFLYRGKIGASVMQAPGKRNGAVWKKCITYDNFVLEFI